MERDEEKWKQRGSTTTLITKNNWDRWLRVGLNAGEHRVGGRAQEVEGTHGACLGLLVYACARGFLISNAPHMKETRKQMQVKVHWFRSLFLMSQCGNNDELALQHGRFCTTWSLVAKGLFKGSRPDYSNLSAVLQMRMRSVCLVGYPSNLVPRGCDPFGQHQVCVRFPFVG